MAGRGPLPKETRQRDRDTRARASEFTTVTRDGVVRGPALVGDYDPRTREWHETWRRSPMAAVFEETDWSRLALLAVIVDGYFRRPSAAALSEIRMNEERLGATYADRQRARIRVEDAQDADVVSLSVVPARESLADRMRAAEAAE
jgi:hypothetical protein